MHLVVTPANSGRAYSEEVGDSYVVTVTTFKPTRGQKTSTGTITSKAGGTLTLKPSIANDTFAITRDGSGEMETLGGTITYTDAIKEVVPSSPIAAVSANKEYPFDGTWSGEGNVIVISKNVFHQIWEDGEQNTLDGNPELKRGQLSTTTENGIHMSNGTTYDWGSGTWKKAGKDEVDGTYTITNNGNTFTLYGEISTDPEGGYVFQREL